MHASLGADASVAGLVRPRHPLTGCKHLAPFPCSGDDPFNNSLVFASLLTHVDYVTIRFLSTVIPLSYISWLFFFSPIFSFSFILTYPLSFPFLCYLITFHLFRLHYSLALLCGTTLREGQNTGQVV